jgi:hypothetical protein
VNLSIHEAGGNNGYSLAKIPRPLINVDQAAAVRRHRELRCKETHSFLDIKFAGSRHPILAALEHVRDIVVM